MTIEALNHVNIETPSLQQTADFLVKLGGLTVGPRPPFDTEGIWLYQDKPGGAAVVHLNSVTEAQHAARTGGPINHIGLDVRGSYQDVTDRLASLGIEYEPFPPVSGSHRALYFHDKASGARIEYVFVDEPS